MRKGIGVTKMPDLSYWGSDKIDSRAGNHAILTCEDHPELRWHTKNIGYIGARSIFFSSGRIADECPCPCSKLRILTDEEFAELEEGW